jgi:hypothetical protein
MRPNSQKTERVQWLVSREVYMRGSNLGPRGGLLWERVWLSASVPAAERAIVPQIYLVVPEKRIQKQVIVSVRFLSYYTSRSMFEQQGTL